jgi:hypothetical protein
VHTNELTQFEKVVYTYTQLQCAKRCIDQSGEGAGVKAFKGAEGEILVQIIEATLCMCENQNEKDVASNKQKYLRSLAGIFRGAATRRLREHIPVFKPTGQVRIF